MRKRNTKIFAVFMSFVMTISNVTALPVYAAPDEEIEYDEIEEIVESSDDTSEMEEEEDYEIVEVEIDRTNIETDTGEAMDLEHPLSTIYVEGTCGAENTEDVQWYLEDDVLRIGVEANEDGGKKMASYNSPQETPWADYMDQIKQVSVYGELQNIGANAFRNCPNLESVIVNHSVSEIEESAFEGCSKLERVTYPFNDSIAVKIYGPYAFKDCVALERITFTLDLTELNDFCFYNCSSLTFPNGLDIQGQLDTIGIGAFWGCTSLTKLKIRANIKEIKGGYADNSELAERLGLDTYYDNVSDCSNYILTEGKLGAFAGCTGLTSVEFYTNNDSGIEEIGEFAFYGCTGLGRVDLPFTLKTIDGYAFEDCTDISEITIADSDVTALTGIFKRCEGLTTATIGTWDEDLQEYVTHIQEIGDETFQNCSGLQNINWSTNNNCNPLSKIGKNAFYGCDSLQSIVLPSGLKTIDENAFRGCSLLESIEIPDGTLSIGKCAFYADTKLQEIYLPDSLTGIGESAFSNENITLEDMRLMDVYYSGNAIQWESLVNNGIGADNDLLVLNNSNYRYKANKYFNTSTELPIPEIVSVSAVDDNFEISWNKVTYTTSANIEVSPTCYYIYMNHMGDYSTESQWKLATPVWEKIAVVSGSEDTYVFSPDESLTDGDIYSFRISASFGEENNGKLSTYYGTNPIIIAQGNCGMENASDVLWELENDVLKIISVGENKMASYESPADTPWAGYKDLIKGVKVYGELKNIGANAFRGCPNLETVSINHSVIEIEESAFEECSKLTAVTCPANESIKVEIYGPYAFKDCVALQNIPITYTVKELNDFCFYNCKSLTFTNGLNIQGLVSTVGRGAFWGCSGITQLVISANVKEIKGGYVDDSELAERLGLDAYYNSADFCSNFQLTEGKMGAFAGCTGLTSVRFRNNNGIGIEDIGEFAFYGCTNLEQVDLPYTLKTVGGYAFEDCKGLKTVTIADSDVYALTGTFKRCEGLVDLTVGTWDESLQEYVSHIDIIGDETFQSCVKLQNIKWATNNAYNSLTRIDNSAFRDCSSLRSVDLPAGLQMIGDRAFQMCTKLESVAIPISTQSIGKNAFYGDTGLKEIYFRDTLTQIDAGAFSNINGMIEDMRLMDVYYSGTEEQWTTFVDNGVGKENDLIVLSGKNYLYKTNKYFACDNTLPIPEMEYAGYIDDHFRITWDHVSIETPFGTLMTPQYYNIYANHVSDKSVDAQWDYQTPMWTLVGSVDASEKEFIYEISDVVHENDVYNFRVQAVFSDVQKSKLSDYISVIIPKPEVIKVTSVSLNEAEIQLTVDESTTLEATILPANATDKTITWSSNEEKVATVDKNGVVTAAAEGKATITALSTDGPSAKCIVTVVAPEPVIIKVTGVSISESEIELNEGESKTLVAKVTPTDATDQTVTWSSSDDEVATVDKTGKVTAVTAGTATITVTSADGPNTKCAVTVIAPEPDVIEVTSVSLNEAKLDMTVGDSVTLTAIITPEDATDKSIKWISSDETVATVDENGKVTAVAEGTTTITVQTTDGKFKVDCVVTVALPVVEVTSVSLNQAKIELKEGETGDLKAMIDPEDATDKTVTWSSSDETIAGITVTEDGLGVVIAAKKAGTATITVKVSDDIKAECIVTVTAIKTDDNDKKEDYTKNSFDIEEAVEGTPVIDEDHTMQLILDENGNFQDAVIKDENGNVDKSIDSYVGNIFTGKKNADGTDQFFSLVFFHGHWDISYDSSTMGAYEYQGESYMVAGGVINQNANGLQFTGDAAGWKFLAAGRVVRKHAGLVMYQDKWFWIDDTGSCDRDYAAIVSWSNANFLVHGGMLRTDFTGYTYDPQNRSVWYHITNGQVWGDGEITDQTIEGEEITRIVISGVVQ